MNLKMLTLKKLTPILFFILVLVLLISCVSAQPYHRGSTHQKYISHNSHIKNTSQLYSNNTDPKNTVSSSGTTSYNPHDGNVYWVGADGKKIVLVNYDNAKNPTYSQLLSFLKADPTDKNRYSSIYMCGDFAEDVHNNAEKAGIKAGWVTLDGIDHSCNAFQTTDKGLVYIDCTGVPGGSASCYDTQVDVRVGSSYVRIPLFCSDVYFESMGIVKDVTTYW